MQIKKFIPFIIFFIFDLYGISLQDLTSPTKSVTIPFLDPVENKKRQLEEVKDRFVSFKTKQKDLRSEIENVVGQIDRSIDEVKREITQTADSEEIEILNKEITVLSNRKQNQNSLLELLEKMEELYQKQLKVLEDFISFYKKKKEDLKQSYSWKEMQQAQAQIYELEAKIETERKLQNSFKKQKVNEKDNILSLQRQEEDFLKEADLISKKRLGQSESREQLNLRILKLKDEVIKEELLLLKEKKQYSSLRIDLLDLEIQLKDFEIEYNQHKLVVLRKNMEVIKSHLKIYQEDVNTAKDEWKSEEQKVAQIIEKINIEKNTKRQEKDKIEAQISNLKEKLKQIKESLESEKKGAEFYLIDSKVQLLEAKADKLGNELDLLDLKIEEAELQGASKKLHYEIIATRYGLDIKEVNLNEKIQYFKRQQELVLNQKKNLQEKYQTVQSLLREINRKIDNIKNKENLVQNQKDIIFKNLNKDYQEVLNNLKNASQILHQQHQVAQVYLTTNYELTQKIQEELLNQYDFTIKDLEARKIVLDIWGRSPKAITLEELQKAFYDAENFFLNLFWETPKHLGPSVLLQKSKRFSFLDIIWILVLLLAFLLSLLLIRLFLSVLYRKISNLLLERQQSSSFLYLSLVKSIIEFSLSHLLLLWSYLFIWLHIVFDFQGIFFILRYFASPYTIAMFYLCSIPILVYMSKHLLLKIKLLNEKLSYLFFAERFQNKFIFLLNAILYSSSILLPLRQAFLNYYDGSPEFPDVILAAYSLILVIVLLLFFSKEDVLKLIPSSNKFFVLVKKKIESYYYPVFIFLMGLLILSNPYIGYSNLAWYLAFVVPLSFLLIYGMFFIHNHLRKIAMFFFLREEGDELIDKFEHAKTYYGFFIVLTFLLLLFGAVILLSRIWGLDYSPSYLWKLLSEEWTIRIDENNKLGVVQFITVVTFIVSGFLISSLVNKFVLNKLFDVFRTEPGTQNTLSRIIHYLILIMAVVLGFAAVHLGYLILSGGALLVFGAGIGLKDLLLDFVAGFFVLIERPIEIGHYIQTDDIRGTVHKISPRVTTIRTARNFSIIVPNKDLVNKPIINWGQGRFAVGLELVVVVDYNSDPEKVREVLSDVVQKNPAILKVPAVVIRLDDFMESGIKFFVRAFISARRVRDQWEVASQLRFAILKAFKENSIVIPYPKLDVNLKDTRNDFVKPIDIKFDETPSNK